MPFQAEQPVQAIRLSDVVSEQARHRNWPRDASAWPHPTAAFCLSFWGNPPDPVLGFRPALGSSQGAAQEGSCLFSTCPDFRQCVHRLRSAPPPAKCLSRAEEMFEQCLSEESHMWTGQDNPGLYAICWWLAAFSSKHFSSLSFTTPIHPRIPTPSLDVWVTPCRHQHWFGDGVTIPQRCQAPTPGTDGISHSTVDMINV